MLKESDEECINSSFLIF